MFQQDNIKLHSAAIITAWVCSGQVLVVRLTACSPDLSPAETFGASKKTEDFFCSTRILHQHSRGGLLNSQIFYLFYLFYLLLKEKSML